MIKLLYPLLLVTIAQVISYLQLQGSSKFPILKGSYWVLAIVSIPIGFLLVKYTELINAYFGATWQGRLIGQGVGVITFSVMSWIIFREPVTVKTGICITLSLIIILINIYWK